MSGRLGAVRGRFVGSIVTGRFHRRDDEDDQGEDDDTPSPPGTPKGPPRPPNPAPSPPPNPVPNVPVPPIFTASGRLGLPPFQPGPLPSAVFSPSGSATPPSLPPTSEPATTTAAVQIPITAPAEPQSTTATPTQAPPTTSAESFSSTDPASQTPLPPELSKGLGQGVPLRFSTTFSTTTRSSTSPAAAPTSGSVLDVPAGPEGAQEDSAAASSSGPRPGAKAGIAVGTIAAAALLVSVLFFLWRRSHARRGRARRADVSEQKLGRSEITAAQTQETRTDAEILRDLMATARAHQNGGLIPDGYVVAGDKKTACAELDAAAPPQAQIRSSIASWLRRHHPLQLNPMSDRSSLRSASPSIRSTPATPRGPLTPTRSPASPSKPQLSPLSGPPTTQAPAPEPTSAALGRPRDLTSGHPRAFPLVDVPPP